MKKIKIHLLLIFTSLMMAGCITVLPLEIGDIQSVEIGEFEGNTFDMDLMIPVKNPNPYVIRITDFDLDVFLNETKVGKIKSLNKVKIPGNADETIKFSANVDISELLSNIFTLLGGVLNDDMKLKIDGYCQAGTFLVTKKIKVTEKDVINLTQD